MTSDRRYRRQMTLLEVGRAGQERLAKARVVVGEQGLAAAVERRYLTAGGVGRLECSREEKPRELPLPMHDPAAGAVAEGAWRALSVMRAVLTETERNR